MTELPERQRVLRDRALIAYGRKLGRQDIRERVESALSEWENRKPTWRELAGKYEAPLDPAVIRAAIGPIEAAPDPFHKPPHTALGDDW